MDDNTIMEMLKQDEETWYSMVIDRYTAYVAAIISGMSRGALSPSDIEEVAADVFFKVWLKREAIRSETMKAFIAQIARNAAIDRLRKKKRDYLPLEEDVLYVSFSEGVDEIAIAREKKEIIEQAVKSFAEPEREIFIRFYYFGETIKKISTRLNMKESTAKTKLHRLRGKLKVIMQERGYGCE